MVVGFEIKTRRSTAWRLTAALLMFLASVAVFGAREEAKAAPATQLDMIGVSSSITVGDDDSVTVRAEDGTGALDTGYTGTIQFSASCGACFEVRNQATNALLPSNSYTFVAADGGDREFLVRWLSNAVGTQSLTVAQTAGPNTVTPDSETTEVIGQAATEVELLGVSTSITAGDTDNVTVILENVLNNKDENYTGTVTFSADCGDCFTITPNNGAGAASKQYTFVVPDAGDKEFTLTWLPSAVGTRSLTVTATLAGGGTATDSQSSIEVLSGAATQVELLGVSTSIMTGQADSITVRLENANNNLDENYTGTVTFSATCGDCFTISPNNGAGAASKQYTFVVGDAGDREFTLTWTQPGTHTLTVTAALAGGGTATDSQDSINVTGEQVTTSSSTSTTVPPSTSSTTTTIPTGSTSSTTTTLPTGSTSSTTTTLPTGSTSSTTTTLPTGSTSSTTTTLPTGSTSSTSTSTTVAGATSSSSSSSSTSTSTTVCGAARITVNPVNVSPGGVITVSGVCFPANTDQTVVLTSNPVTLGVVRVASNGTFSAQFRIPSNTTSGAHTITVSGSGATASASINVIRTGGLGVTGGNAGLLALAAAVIFGGLVMIVGRKLGDENDAWASRL
jgi:hypothetical protein